MGDFRAVHTAETSSLQVSLDYQSESLEEISLTLNYVLDMGSRYLRRDEMSPMTFAGYGRLRTLEISLRFVFDQNSLRFVTDAGGLTSEQAVTVAVVDVNETGLVRQSTVLDKRMRTHLGHDVQKIKLLRDLLSSIRTSKDRLVPLDGYEIVLEQPLNTPLLSHRLERGAVLGHRKHGGQAGGVAKLNG